MDPAIVTAFGAFVTGGGIGVGFKAWLEYRRGTRKDSDEVAMGLVDRLTARMEYIEALAERERQKCDAELRALRHQMANVDSAFDGFLMMVEAGPDRAGEYAALIRDKRAKQRQTEAVEKAAVMTAGMRDAPAPLYPPQENP